MLKPSYRLRASADIARVVKSGRRARFLGFTLYVAPSSSSGGVSRCACIAGKRVHASSVVRHEVQRRMRAACARVLPALLDHCDIVLVADGGVLLTMDFQDFIRTIYYGVVELTI